MKPHPHCSLFIAGLALLLAACAPTSQSTPIPTVAETPIAEIPTSSGNWIQLVPDRAAPGEQILIQGFIHGGPDAAEAQANGTSLSGYLCWQSCLTGLAIPDLPVTWSADEPGRFTMPFTIPSIPWLGVDGPHPLVPGEYTLGVQCLGRDTFGCATREAQATATLHLEGPVAERCQENQPCLELSLSRDSGRPGEQVEVSGWAPLANSNYSLVIVPEDATGEPAQVTYLTQQPDGSLSGSFQVPQIVSGLGSIVAGEYRLALQTYSHTQEGEFRSQLLIETPFTIESGLSWVSISAEQPIWIQLADNRIQPPQVTVAPPGSPYGPGESGRLAYCAPGEVRLSLDLGQSWTGIPTAGVIAAAEAAGYTLFQNQDGTPIPCDSVSLDAAHPESFYAIFETANPEFGAPPVFFMGFFTADAGATWQMVPAPSTQLAENFGGFAPGTGSAVQALFGQPDPQADLTVVQTLDGGLTWVEASLACPEQGPCLRWGPAGGSIGGMGSPLPQLLLASIDEGQTWDPAGPYAELRMPGPKELVFYAPGQALLLSAEQYPAQLSRDGGQTWEVVALPVLPETSAGPAFPQGLQLLPDGSLLALSSQDSSWYLLPPGAGNWCSAAAQGLPAFPVLFQAAGDRVWWLSPVDSRLQEMGLDQFACGN